MTWKAIELGFLSLTVMDLSSCTLPSGHHTYNVFPSRVFIIDGILTVGTALYGIIFFPGTPDTTTAFYFTEKEKIRCRERMKEEGVVMRHKLTWDIFIRILKSWQFYVLAILFG